MNRGSRLFVFLELEHYRSFSAISANEFASREAPFLYFLLKARKRVVFLVGNYIIPVDNRAIHLW